MLAMAAVAVAWANSPWADAYRQLAALPTALRVGPIGVEKPLVLFVNDGLMAVFFLLVGVEIKRELAHGSLASLRQALLPAFAAAGGMALPALIFAATIGIAADGNPLALRGWAIPCATDIAFSLVVLKLAAPRAPPALVVFLAAVAVIDDLGSILIIAVFYTEQLSPAMLLAAFAPLAALVALNRMRVESVAPYVVAGLMRSEERRDGKECKMTIRDLLVHRSGLGLGAGKTLGVSLGTRLGTRFGGARLPSQATWPQVVAVAMLAGIGITMSIFVASLAYESAAPGLFNGAKVGILFGSVVAALAGAVSLRTVSRDRGMP